MTEPFIRWEDRSKLRPKGMLQSTYPLTRDERDLAEVVGEDAVRQHRPTELNPSGIYAPPGDPLHRPTAAEIIAAMSSSIPGPTVRWRWWRDPLVIGAVIGLALVVATFFAVIP